MSLIENGESLLLIVELLPRLDLHGKLLTFRAQVSRRDASFYMIFYHNLIVTYGLVGHSFFISTTSTLLHPSILKIFIAPYGSRAN